jgi:hypothetical protein
VTFLHLHPRPISGALLQEKGAAHIDLVHEVVALHWGVQSAREGDGTGVVHQNVDPAKFANLILHIKKAFFHFCQYHRLLDSLVHLGLVAHVNLQGQSFAACLQLLLHFCTSRPIPAHLLDLFRGSVDGARE